MDLKLYYYIGATRGFYPTFSPEHVWIILAKKCNTPCVIKKKKMEKSLASRWLEGTFGFLFFFLRCCLNEFSNAGYQHLQIGVVNQSGRVKTVNLTWVL